MRSVLQLRVPIVRHLVEPYELVLHAEGLGYFVEIPVALVRSGEAPVDCDYALWSWHLE